MEDIDAAGSVVLRRNEDEGALSHASFMHEALRALRSSSPGHASPKGKGSPASVSSGPDLVRAVAVSKWTLHALTAVSGRVGPATCVSSPSKGYGIEHCGLLRAYSGKLPSHSLL